jgi:hypothetical protein
LQDAAANPDAEIARRADECRRHVEENRRPAVETAAARLLAERAPPGAAAAVLAYLPEADDVLAEELQAALASLARRAPAPDPALAAALADAHPVRRAAAAEALARAGLVEPVRSLFRDPDPVVRLRAGLGLATHERAAIPILIDLLAELPPDRAWAAEEALQRLAGDAAPRAELGRGRAAACDCRDAWRAWWARNGAAADLTRLEAGSPATGVTLYAQTMPGGYGAVVELGPDRTPRRQIDGLHFPVAFASVARDRVLVAEFTLGRVSERDFAGTVVWEKSVPQPVACQRLPGGRTFIAARDQVLEVDRSGHELFAFPVENVAAAAVRSDGRVVVVTYTGHCSVLDATGRELRGFAVGRCSGVAGIGLTPGGHVLVPEYDNDRVAEYDLGGTPMWTAPVRQPSAVERLPNGHLLVSSQGTRKVVEIDRQGRTVWEYQLPANARVWQARRR